MHLNFKSQHLKLDQRGEVLKHLIRRELWYYKKIIVHVWIWSSKLSLFGANLIWSNWHWPIKRKRVYFLTLFPEFHTDSWFLWVFVIDIMPSLTSQQWDPSPSTTKLSILSKDRRYFTTTFTTQVRSCMEHCWFNRNGLAEYQLTTFFSLEKRIGNTCIIDAKAAMKWTACAKLSPRT